MGRLVPDCLFDCRSRVVLRGWKNSEAVGEIETAVVLHESVARQQERLGAFSVRSAVVVLSELLFIFWLDIRTVAVEEAQNLCLIYNCQFYEVSAADSYSGVHLAFQSMLKEARSSSLQRSLPIRRKLGVNTVGVNFSKVKFWNIWFYHKFL